MVNLPRAACQPASDWLGRVTHRPEDHVLNSMTAFASAKGALGAQSWTWELRSVNGKGLDLRLRLPDWIEGLEPALRARLSSMARVEARAQDTGVTLAPSTPADLVAMRGVLDTASADHDTAALRDAILADFETPLADFLAMRAAEGGALATI